jgi:hypothetical protein
MLATTNVRVVVVGVKVFRITAVSEETSDIVFVDIGLVMK